MEDSLLIDAVERFVKGEMPEQERIYFEELRKNNSELDQAVVEHMFFLNELNAYSTTRNFKHTLNEVETKLAEEGFIFRAPLKGKAKIIQLWNKYKRTVAVAASIAGVVSLCIGTVVTAVNNNPQNDIKPLVDIINETKIKTDSIASKVDKLEDDVATGVKNNPALPVIKPKIAATFRATGFLIDANNNYIVTNAHVVNKAKKQLVVENTKGEQFNAEVIHVDASRDIAIIKIRDNNFKKLPAIPYTIRKSNADLGEQVFMLGYPKAEIVYGEGYVSAKNGSGMDTIYCQLNTAANEGSSGSPVVNKKGELIGIITSAERNAQGVVYAIKSINIHRAVEEAKKKEANAGIRIISGSGLKGLNRESQIKKMEDYVFMVKGD
ncbi:MAG: trypsin-like peptidase domain-containing protein [Rhizobacter sp.]|nr:trypsin-like peptidase domain-containing protein [Ferruginibacter sp.]